MKKQICNGRKLVKQLFSSIVGYHSAMETLKRPHTDMEWPSPNYGEGNGTPLQYFAWKIPWMEEPGRLQSMGSWRVGHDWATSLSLFTFMHWRRKWQPTPLFLPGESQGWGSLVAAVYGVTQSWTRLKWLSSHQIR